MAGAICYPNNKTCATCAFWGGNRKVNPSLRFVELQSANEKGICAASRMQLGSMQKCSKYQKLGCLK
jgi:hypothetical protein